MKKTLLFLLLVFLSFSAFAQQNQLSESAQISVLTVGPGASLNDSFGHSAFRIKDKKKGIDAVYGYGEYDFEAPNFYLKFAQGKLHYLISKTNFNRFFQVYVYFNRSIKEQVLNLSGEEKQRLYDYLINNYKPENRKYLYDFFFDNCATKIKDVVKVALNDSITFYPPKDYKEASFRTLIQNNLNRNSWGSLGIDIALGSVIDRTATAEQHMFLPENIYTFFENAAIKNNNQPLVKQSRVIYAKKEIPQTSSFFTSPLFILSIVSLFIIFITYKDYKSQTRYKWLDIALFSITGLIGIFILLLWFATDHLGTHQNYNLLWAFALNILVLGQLYKKKVSPWFKKYLKLLIILLCLLTLHWIIGVQVFAIGLIPLLIALFLRYIFLVKHFNNIG
ncbi:lipoprotein N-acyltransferase Lnb domain-containing protein [Flavisericum labens]|uniref:lipoprotein N-acyltransferase Lnb domain-containing protein n=1 Tax=Flavisericum labens TaxID=3377112 RepID=UPI00387B3E72